MAVFSFSDLSILAPTVLDSTSVVVSICALQSICSNWDEGVIRNSAANEMWFSYLNLPMNKSHLYTSMYFTSSHLKIFLKVFWRYSSAILSFIFSYLLRMLKWVLPLWIVKCITELYWLQTLSDLLLTWWTSLIKMLKR